VPPHPESWLEVRPQGLLVRPGGFFVDPVRSVDVALISHGHSDHARSGHGTVLATTETLEIMRHRLGGGAGMRQQALAYGERIRLGTVTAWLAPAGHVLGSAQIVLEHEGVRVVVSGDYKRRPDPTCPGFEPVPCDLFITEATFGLPVFRHPDPMEEIRKLLKSVAVFPERCHVVGCYALGKAQRVIALLREAGWDRPLYLHGALMPMCDVYMRHGIALGELRAATAGTSGEPRPELAGEIVLAPPAAINDRWARRLPDAVVCLASGWMRVRQRARQRGVELPLVLSDHADWDELLQTMDDVRAPEVWVTHGREEALVHAATQKGIRARALALVGYEEDEGG
jgi:putative mRNA 3-end processing factor